MVIVDLHSHFYPLQATGEGLPVQVDDPGDGSIVVTVPGGRFRVPSALCDPQAQQESLAVAGLDARVLQIPPFTVLYELEGGVGLRHSRAVNDALAVQAAESHGRLIGFATVPLQAGGAVAAAELTRAHGIGLRGVQVLSSVVGRSLADQGLEPFFATAAELGMPVFVHPHFVSGADRMTAFHLRNLVGNPNETTLTGAQLWSSGLLERYPDLEIVLAHGGGYFPALSVGRLEHGFRVRPELARIGLSPADAARRMYYDSIIFDPVLIRQLVELVGPDRVVVGTDYPFDMGEPTPVRLVRQAAEAATTWAPEVVLGAGAKLLTVRGAALPHAEIKED